jgi:predicted nucleic acid-binding protein
MPMSQKAASHRSRFGLPRNSKDCASTANVDVVMGHPGISARDALHLAIMEAHGIQKIASFGRGFDGFPGIVRLS